jgi:hypothetical protein
MPSTRRRQARRSKPGTEFFCHKRTQTFRSADAAERKSVDEKSRPRKHEAVNWSRGQGVKESSNHTGFPVLSAIVRPPSGGHSPPHVLFLSCLPCPVFSWSICLLPSASSGKDTFLRLRQELMNRLTLPHKLCYPSPQETKPLTQAFGRTRMNSAKADFMYRPFGVLILRKGNIQPHFRSARPPVRHTLPPEFPPAEILCGDRVDAHAKAEAAPEVEFLYTFGVFMRGGGQNSVMFV